MIPKKTAPTKTPKAVTTKPALGRKAAKPKAASVDAYLAALPPAERAALTTLRKVIQAAAPKATEVISYQVPTFKHCGALVAFSASPKHCALHLMSPPLMRSLAAELAAYDVGTATIRFTVDEPLPASLVKKLVRARIAENEAREKGQEA